MKIKERHIEALFLTTIIIALFSGFMFCIYQMDKQNEKFRELLIKGDLKIERSK